MSLFDFDADLRTNSLKVFEMDTKFGDAVWHVDKWHVEVFKPNLGSNYFNCNKCLPQKRDLEKAKDEVAFRQFFEESAIEIAKLVAESDDVGWIPINEVNDIKGKRSRCSLSCQFIEEGEKEPFAEGRCDIWIASSLILDQLSRRVFHGEGWRETQFLTSAMYAPRWAVLKALERKRLNAKKNTYHRIPNYRDYWTEELQTAWIDVHVGQLSL